MPERDVAQHLRKQVVEVGAARQTRQEYGVEVLRFVQVEPVGIGIVKIIAFNAPSFVVHLTPLGTRVNEDLHRGKLKRSVPRFSRLRGWGYGPLPPFAVQCLLTVKGKDEVRRAVHPWLNLTGLQIELLNRYRRRGILSPEPRLFYQIDFSALARQQVVVVPRRNRKSEDALIQSVKVDLYDG